MDGAFFLVTHSGSMAPRAKVQKRPTYGLRQTIKGRLTIKVLSATTYNFKFEMSPDGTTWNTVLEGKDTKK